LRRSGLTASKQDDSLLVPNSTLAPMTHRVRFPLLYLLTARQYIYSPPPFPLPFSRFFFRSFPDTQSIRNVPVPIPFFFFHFSVLRLSGANIAPGHLPLATCSWKICLWRVRPFSLLLILICPPIPVKTPFSLLMTLDPYAYAHCSIGIILNTLLDRLLFYANAAPFYFHFLHDPFSRRSLFSRSRLFSSLLFFLLLPLNICPKVCGARHSFTAHLERPCLSPTKTKM